MTVMVECPVPDEDPLGVPRSLWDSPIPDPPPDHTTADTWGGAEAFFNGARG